MKYVVVNPDDFDTIQKRARVFSDLQTGDVFRTMTESNIICVRCENIYFYDACGNVTDKVFANCVRLDNGRLRYIADECAVELYSDTLLFNVNKFSALEYNIVT